MFLQDHDAAPAEVSVLLLAYNHAPYVEQALDAIARQTHQSFELVIVDDCSQDATAAVIRDWLARTEVRATFIRNEVNLGVSAARNVALARSEGRFIVTAAADDFYEFDRLERQATHLRSLDESVALVYGDLRTVDEGGRPVADSAQRWLHSPPPTDNTFERLLGSNFIPGPIVMTRRSAIEAVGGWDEQVVFDDWDLWLRLARDFDFSYLPGVVSNYRLVETSLSRDPRWALRRSESTVRILSKWFGVGEPYASIAFRRALKSARAAIVLDRERGRDLMLSILGAFPSRRHRAIQRMYRMHWSCSLLRAGFSIAHRVKT